MKTITARRYGLAVAGIRPVLLVGLLLFIFGCQPQVEEMTVEPKPNAETVLLSISEMGPDFLLVSENTGKRTKEDYTLEEEEWEEFGWVEGNKITFQNKDKTKLVFNYNSIYLNQEIMFEEYKETKMTAEGFTVIPAPTVGEDSIVFMYEYATYDSIRGWVNWTEVDVTFLSKGIYENIGILQKRELVNTTKNIEEAVDYAKKLENKITLGLTD